MNKLIKYDNGLRLVLNVNTNVRSVVSSIWVGAGSGIETPQNNGIAHFTEHMTFKGTPTLTPFDVANEFEKVGALVNAFTSKECTCYYVKSVDDVSERCFELLADIFVNSVYEPAELDKERNVIIEEINMVEDSPEDICYDKIASAAFPDASIGQTILGPLDNVRNFTRDDVINFIDDYYCADNIVVAISGNVSEEYADKLVKKYLLNYVRTKKSKRQFCKKIYVKSNYAQRIKDFEQSNISIAFPSLKYNDERFYEQTIVTAVMGGGMSSRLFQIIREQLGLAYSVYTGAMTYVNNGLFNVALNVSVANIEKAIIATCKELKKAILNGITNEEFMRAKVQLRANNVFAQESVQAVMSALGKNMILADELFDANEQLSKIDAVTIDGVNAFIKELFSSKSVCSAYVGKDPKIDVMSLIKENLNG